MTRAAASRRASCSISSASSRSWRRPWPSTRRTSEGVVEGLDVLKERFEDLIERGPDGVSADPGGQDGRQGGRGAAGALPRQGSAAGVLHVLRRARGALRDPLARRLPPAVPGGLQPADGDVPPAAGELRAGRPGRPELPAEDRPAGPGAHRDRDASGPRRRSTSSTPRRWRRSREANTPDTVKVFNLLKALHAAGRGEGPGTALPDQHRRQGRGDRPGLSRIARRRRRTPSKSWRGWSRELKEAESQRDETELPPEAFAVFWYAARPSDVDPGPWTSPGRRRRRSSSTRTGRRAAMRSKTSAGSCTRP